MQFIAFFSLISVAVAGTSWYDPAADVTCSGDHETGGISCQSGHLDDAPEVNVADLQSRNIESLDKRVSCNIQVGPVDGCFLHCFAIGYCNAYCDEQNTCICRCMDNSGICVDTTCN
ncbi:hypothetical protein CC79DRAFT_1365397 [Sarocladium strictum]